MMPLDDKDEFEYVIENPHLRRLYEKYAGILHAAEPEAFPPPSEIPIRFSNPHLQRLYEKYTMERGTT